MATLPTNLPLRLVTAGEIDHDPPKNIKSSLKKCVHICSLNVRTLSSTEKLLELKAALQHINYDILGLCEIRRLGENIIEDEDHIMYCFGQTKGLNGVGFLVKKKLKEHIIRFTGISERVCVLEIELGNQSFAIIQSYAPIERSTQEDIDIYYRDLAKAHEMLPKNYIISMGDFNAQIGKPKSYENKVTGKYGYGKRSKRGERLIQYAYEHNLKVLNTMFKRKEKNCWTWISPDKNTKNEIDYILTTVPHLFSKYEVLSSFKFASDHRIIRATLNLTFRKKSRRHFSNLPATLKTSDEQKLYLTHLSQFIPSLIETHESCTSNEYCQKIENSITESLKNVKKQRNPKSKILSEKAIKLIEERSTLQNKHMLTKNEKEDLKRLYKETNREIKKCYETYRANTLKKHLENSRSAKKAFKELDSTKKWIPYFKTDLKKSTSRAEIINTATNFYSKLYSRPCSEKQFNAKIHQNNASTAVHTFEESEILKQIQKLNLEKSPGPDGISNECIKCAKALLLTPITILFNKILEEEHVPQHWTESIITLLYKKGDPADIENYRPISLISCLCKLFMSCILYRISPHIDCQQPCEQAGFRKGYSTMDHIHTIEQIIEKYLEFRKPLYLAFIDYKKAFDSISHNSIWEALSNQSINNKYINILKNIYSKSTSRVRLDRTGTCINILRGVRQGDPISPKLFIAVLQNIMKDLPWSKQGININGKFLSHLRFADDIILLSENPTKLNIMINELLRVSKNVGLEMNLNKTKVMTNDKATPILVNNTPLEYVQEYTYLGKQISFKTERNIEELDKRIATTWKKFWAHKDIFKSKLSLKIKKMVMDSAILPCLTYGCQTWTFDTKTKQKIQTTQRAMERSCLGLKLRDRVRNTNIRKKTNVTDALRFSQSLKWKWAGHVARHSDNRWTKTVTEWKGPRGSRARGRPCARWQDEIVTTAGKNWLDIAKDRDKWQSLEEAFTLRGSIHLNK